MTAAFRSKTRRLLALPHAWRSRASHFRARRPSWSPIPSCRMDLARRRSTSPLGSIILSFNRRVRGRNAAGRLPSHRNCSRHRFPAAHAVQQPRREPRAVATAYGHGYRGGRRGTLQRPYEAMSVCPSELLLAQDAPGARITGKAVWDMVRSHTGSRNTCNVKTLDPGPPRRGPRRIPCETTAVDHELHRIVSRICNMICNQSYVL